MPLQEQVIETSKVEENLRIKETLLGSKKTSRTNIPATAFVNPLIAAGYANNQTEALSWLPSTQVYGVYLPCGDNFLRIIPMKNEDMSSSRPYRIDVVNSCS